MKITINIKKSIIFGFSILFWITTTWLHQFNFISTINSIFLFLIGLGYLLLKLLRIKTHDYQIFTILSISLSLLTIMGLGFFLNNVSFLTRIKPFEDLYVKIFFALYTLSVFLLYIYKNNADQLVVNIKLRLKTILFQLLLITTPILSILGTIRLNNGNDNKLVIVAIIIILITFCYLAFSNRIKKNYYLLSLISISISLTTMYSMRSNYLVGWDIHQEFRVFEITKNNGIWSISNYVDPYNATLSITILPTMLSKLIGLSDLMIFKLLFPILLGLVPANIYLYSKKILGEKLAYISTFFFISQYQFMQQMPALNRQVISFIFFSTITLLLTFNHVNQRERKILFFLNSVGLVISHYSTAYVTIIIFLLSISLVNLISLVAKVRSKYSQTIQNSNLSPIMLLFLIFFTIYWYGFYTSTASNVAGITKKVFSNLNKIYSHENKSNQAINALWDSNNGPTERDLITYRAYLNKQYKPATKWLISYPENITSKYKSYLIFSNDINVKNKLLKNISQYLLEVSKKTIKILLIIGLIYQLFNIFSTRSLLLHIDQATTSLGGSILLFSTSVVPFISVYYNFERLYQQLLVILTVTIAMGLMCVPFFSKDFKFKFFVLIVIIYFCNQVGILNQVLGGAAYLNLNNSGEDYDRFYTVKAEITSAQWLSNNMAQNSTISLDPYSWLRFQSSTYKVNGFINILIPEAIPKYGYVYSSLTNTVKITTREIFKNNTLKHNFPSDFLNDNKSVVYNNKYSIIYK